MTGKVQQGYRGEGAGKCSFGEMVRAQQDREGGYWKQGREQENRTSSKSVRSSVLVQAGECEGL